MFNKNEYKLISRIAIWKRTKTRSIRILNAVTADCSIRWKTCMRTDSNVHWIAYTDTMSMQRSYRIVWRWIFWNQTELIFVPWNQLFSIFVCIDWSRTWAPSCSSVWVFRATSKRRCQSSEQEKKGTKCKRNADQVRCRVSTEKKKKLSSLFTRSHTSLMHAERHAVSDIGNVANAQVEAPKLCKIKKKKKKNKQYLR